jgi:mono/diheme cytochrome c family protein
MNKFIRWTAIVIGGLFLLVALAGLVLYPIGVKKLNQAYPDIAIEAVNIPTDADAIARGQHIATIWACTRCHGEDLSGRMITKDPLSGLVPLMGTISAANLTSGKGGVASSYTDADWVRAIRHGVLPGGQVEILMFNYSTMSDQDLGELIAYLKQIPPIDTNNPASNDGPVLPLVAAAGLLPPAAEQIDHEATLAVAPMPDATVEYGAYLAAVCTACHASGIGKAVKNWKQDEFIHTFQTGVLPDGKQFGLTMSSKTFREMNDTELTALWLYFTNPKP